MKSIDEIKGTLQTWPEGFKNQFGREISKQELLDYFVDLKKRKEQLSIKNQFETYHALDVQMMIDYLNSTNNLPNINCSSCQAPLNQLELVETKQEPKKKKGK